MYDSLVSLEGIPHPLTTIKVYLFLTFESHVYLCVYSRRANYRITVTSHFGSYSIALSLLMINTTAR